MNLMWLCRAHRIITSSLHVIACAYHLPKHIHCTHLHTLWYKKKNTQQINKIKKKNYEKKTHRIILKSRREILHKKKIRTSNVKNAFNWIKWKKIPQNIALDNDFVFRLDALAFFYHIYLHSTYLSGVCLCVSYHFVNIFAQQLHYWIENRCVSNISFSFYWSLLIALFEFYWTK